MAKRINAGYYISEGFHNVFSHGFMSFAAVCMIVACLLIMGTFTLVAVNMEHMLGELERENEFIAYIDETYTREQAQGLEKDLTAIENVAGVTFVTKEEARQNYLQGREEVELLKELPSTVFRDRFRIHVDDIREISATVDRVKTVSGVAKVVVALEIAQGFVLVRNIALGVALVLIAMLMIISLFIIANTIKLATFYRREEIAIMKMCGATNGFVRWPFVYEGMLLGLAGAVVAFFLQWGVYQLVCGFIGSNAGLGLVAIIPYTAMAARIFIIFLVSGFVIGVAGSLMAIRKFLQV
ncbi:MAG: permease-like cell division protein FtsX [Oscillospiraceae bacterium]|nr:permease-like cell division protein FtsX [Oscillospiraceae bacterium]